MRCTLAFVPAVVWAGTVAFVGTAVVLVGTAAFLGTAAA